MIKKETNRFCGFIVKIDAKNESGAIDQMNVLIVLQRYQNINLPIV